MHHITFLESGDGQVQNMIYSKMKSADMPYLCEGALKSGGHGYILCSAPQFAE